jgi:hypothetical protein
MLIPCILSAKNYKYSSVHIFEQGTDYFSIDKSIVNNQAGRISINGNSLTIDHKRYSLRHFKRGKGLYKSKGCFFRLVYSSGTLVGLQQWKYGRIYSYDIADENTIITTNSERVKKPVL